MRWDELFGDLAAQWDAEERRELDAQVADRTRRERAAVGLYERLSAAGTSPSGWPSPTAPGSSGPVADVGDGWVLLGQPGRCGAGAVHRVRGGDRAGEPRRGQHDGSPVRAADTRCEG